MNARSSNQLGIVSTLSIAFVLSLWVVLFIVTIASIQNGTLWRLWSTIQDGQAQVISSALAALGLLTSAVLVPFIFKDRMRDLDSAVAEMKSTIGNLEKEASSRLDSLSKLLDEKMTQAEQRTSEDVDRIGEALDEIRSAVILSVSDGHISDPKHAKAFVRHLYNDAVNALHRKVREKSYLRDAVRAQIALLRTMSTQYLNKLSEYQIITQNERSLVDRIKEFAYRRSDFVLSDINEINRARSDFDKTFGKNAVQNPDASI
jgi:sugar-specific transcriptional regulator TrmB